MIHCLPIVTRTRQFHPFIRFLTSSTSSYRLKAFSTKSSFMASVDILEEFKKLQLDSTKNIPSCYPEYNPLDVYRLHIAKSVSEVLKVDPAIVFPVLLRPQVLEKGDLALPIPALRLKGEKPNVIAARLVEQFPKSPFIEKITAADIHVQFYFNTAALNRVVIPSILKNRTTWGSNPSLGWKDPNNEKEGKKRIIVEFSSPNIAKPFHAGHLRSTIIGGFLVNLYRSSGWDVIAMNYLGDWGKQYGLLALGFQKFGNEKELEQDPIQHLFQVYVKINQQVKEEQEEIKEAEAAGKDTTELKKNSLDEQARKHFKAMCDNDEKALATWRRFRDLSIERYKIVYARLNIHYDVYAGESQVTEESMNAAEKQLSDLGLTTVSEGATVVDFSKQIPGKLGKQLGVALLRKKDGTSLYLTRDLGEMFTRYGKYSFDKMIYVVAASQELHLRQLFKMVELIDNAHKTDLHTKVSHIGFGLVKGMSTRKGTVVFLDDVLREVRDTMHEVMRKNSEKYAQVSEPEKTADILGISSVMVQDMSGKRINGYDFDLEVMTSFEGDTGPYLQYSHARLCSIINKAGLSASEIATGDINLLTEAHATNIVRCLMQYPDTIQQTMTTLEPTTILTYLFRLTHALNSSYDVLRVIGSSTDVMKARLALYDATRAVLGHGMRILGLSPLERM